MKEQEIKAVNEIANVLIDNKGKMLIEVAIALYNADYRKQEWISVDDRLPEVASKLLLFSPSDGINLGCMTEDKRFYVYKSYPDRPTHWMPLPEPPKMKGGAE